MPTRATSRSRGRPSRRPSTTSQGARATSGGRTCACTSRESPSSFGCCPKAGATQRGWRLPLTSTRAVPTAAPSNCTGRRPSRARRRPIKRSWRWRRAERRCRRRSGGGPFSERCVARVWSPPSGWCSVCCCHFPRCWRGGIEFRPHGGLWRDRSATVIAMRRAKQTRWWEKPA